MRRYLNIGPSRLAVTTLVLVCASAAHADQDNMRTLDELCSSAREARLMAGSPDAAAAIASVVADAGQVPNEAGQRLLPPGTTVDQVWWVENVIQIRLTVPATAIDWRLSPLDQEALSKALGSPFAHDSAFGGTWLKARLGPDREYGSTEQFLPKPPSTVDPADLPNEPFEPIKPKPEDDPGMGPRFGGPTAQAGRQPIGALTGVTVFASAGHGWTADNVGDGGSTDFEWYLQRPVLLDMCEDYGNIDQLNNFVHYAFNAGATVVPFRPVGWQPIEVVLDNDDPGVTFAGAWSDGSSSKYYENGATMSGVVYRWISASAIESGTARYTPEITISDFYPVYCFTVASTNRTLQTYRVSHSGGISQIVIDHRNVGNGWIWLGNYYLEAGGDNYVEITNESSDSGVIVADAIRWGGGYGDIVRPGPGTISGYPRDQECQRYWAQSELGNNAVGFDSEIWNPSGIDDGSDNVRVGAKWAREMNQTPAGGVQVDRWKRIHLEFHTNASGGAARGQLTLITSLGETTYQREYATILSDEVDADMLILDEEFEHSWYDRMNPTYTGQYGAICTPANGNEFDATIVELAFHDNQDDTELLRDSRIRSAMARSCVQGIIRFLNTLPGSEVPLAFAPDTPRYVRAEDAGGGDIVVTWDTPLSDGARGDPAAGYVVYQSSNGYGFGNPIIVDDVLTATIPDVPVGETRYFRVAATNSGGESMPSEVLAVRRPAEGTANILIVNGFDRLRRQINPIQTFEYPPDYAGRWIERQVWRESNSFDYVVQHAEALAASGHGFVSCSNENIIDSRVHLGDYDIAVWILGTESTEDATFNSNEQNKVISFLEDGGALFVSGAEIAFDLINQAHGLAFAQDVLRIGYVADDADTFEATGVAGSILGDVAQFDFDPEQGAPYYVRTPDVLSPRSDAVACLDYVGGSGGVAGVQYTGLIYNVVTFGFPFETITSPTARAEIMQRVIDFLASAAGPRPFDYNRDGDVDFDDFGTFLWCFQGPGTYYPDGHACVDVPGEADLDIDLLDFSLLQQNFTGALDP